MSGILASVVIAIQEGNDIGLPWGVSGVQHDQAPHPIPSFCSLKLFEVV